MKSAKQRAACHHVAGRIICRMPLGTSWTHPPKRVFMSGMTDGQQLRNAQWGKVSRLFKPAMIISAALTASAETFYRTGAYPRAIFEAGSADARTWLYVALMYLIAFPVLFLWMRRLLAGYPMPWNPPLKRWFLGAFSLILCSGMIHAAGHRADCWGQRCRSRQRAVSAVHRQPLRHIPCGNGARLRSGPGCMAAVYRNPQAALPQAGLPLGRLR
ncbi:hypothetical protein BN126360168 [Stenotrophomonas thermophila]|nr:hypothetical protein BN126360168 [Stenotrophomonas maltophilia]